MTKIQKFGNVERITVTRPVSFRGDVFRHRKRNRVTPDDTGIVTFAGRRCLRNGIVSDFEIRI
jgi:hypothetical protein